MTPTSSVPVHPSPYPPRHLLLHHLFHRLHRLLSSSPSASPRPCRTLHTLPPLLQHAVRRAPPHILTLALTVAPSVRTSSAPPSKSVLPFSHISTSPSCASNNISPPDISPSASTTFSFQNDVAAVAVAPCPLSRLSHRASMRTASSALRVRFSAPLPHIAPPDDNRKTLRRRHRSPTPQPSRRFSLLSNDDARSSDESGDGYVDDDDDTGDDDNNVDEAQNGKENGSNAAFNQLSQSDGDDAPHVQNAVPDAVNCVAVDNTVPVGGEDTR